MNEGAALGLVLDQVSKDKNIDRTVLVETLEQAILTAAKRAFGMQREMEAKFNEEIGRVDRWVRKHMVEKFGPVRTVTPELVFELAFEGVQRSTRHKSGVAVRFPRILRWREDKPAAEADTLDTLKTLLPTTETRSPGDSS